MTKNQVETIASMVDGLLAANKSIVTKSENKLRFVIVDLKQNDMHYFLSLASTLANSALKDGFCSLETLKKSFTRTSPMPDKELSFQVERNRFIIGCFFYRKENQCHLMIFGK
jgi:hypothetical protein